MSNQYVENAKSVTIKMSESVLQEIEEYGFTYSDFIEVAVRKALNNLKNEQLVQDYKQALAQTRQESQQINQEVFPVSKIADE